MSQRSQRPRFLNLLQIRLPITGVASIGHRISGVLLVLMIPFGLYLLELSLRDAAGYRQATELLRQPLIALSLLFVLWALAHHLFAGLRHLLLDLDIGVSRAVARKSAWLVVFGGAAVFIAGWLL